MSGESRTDLLIEKIRKDTDLEVRAIVEKAEKIRQDRNKAQDGLEKREKKDLGEKKRKPSGRNWRNGWIPPSGWNGRRPFFNPGTADAAD